MVLPCSPAFLILNKFFKRSKGQKKFDRRCQVSKHTIRHVCRKSGGTLPCWSTCGLMSLINDQIELSKVVIEFFRGWISRPWTRATRPRLQNTRSLISVWKQSHWLAVNLRILSFLCGLAGQIAERRNRLTDFLWSCDHKSGFVKQSRKREVTISWRLSVSVKQYRH